MTPKTDMDSVYAMAARHHDKFARLYEDDQAFKFDPQHEQKRQYKDCDQPHRPTLVADDAA